jgi:hypothetical protein
MRVEFEHVDIFMDKYNNRDEIQALSIFLFKNPRFIRDVAMVIRDGTTIDKFKRYKYNYIFRKYSICIFRSKTITNSAANRSLIPV